MPNQYADLYNKEHKCILSAEARHVPRMDSQNPYITALPPARAGNELVLDCTIFPGLPDKESYRQLTGDEKLRCLEKLNKARIYLPYYVTIEDAVDRALVESYERRVSVKTNSPHLQYTQNDEALQTCRYSEITEMSDAPTGFALLGQSGCGKTTGINNVLRKYPKYIIHQPGTMEQHIQIPILLVHMSENNNFHGLYQRIGYQIDKTLGNTASAYENELGRKGDSLSVKFNKLQKIINIFNIGILIIDEIELIDISHTKEGTLETFLSLSNLTGIAIGVIGTEDAFGKLFKRPRTTRRIGELINADSYCSSKPKVKAILSTLYQYLPEEESLDEACVNAYYTESGGVIAYITKIFVYVAKELAKQKSKNKSATTTPKLIHTISKQKLAGKKILDRQIDRIVEDEEYSDATLRMLVGKNDTDTDTQPDSPEIIRADRMPTLRNIVKSAIHAFPGYTYTDEEIESALKSIITKVPENNIQAAITATLVELNRQNERKQKKKNKKALEDATILNLQKLKDSLPVSTDV